MKKISILYFCLMAILFISPLVISAKELKEETFTYGGSSWDYFRDVTATSDGGYVAVGYTYSTDIKGITNNGYYDGIIVKYDKSGKIEWQKNYGGNYSDHFYEVTTTTDGGYVVVGTTFSTDIKEITNKESGDAIIIKYDKDGNIKWQKSYGGSDSDVFYDVISTTDGGYVVIGSTYSTDIEGITNRGSDDAVIVKYDKDGNMLWQKNYGGSNSDYFYGLTTTSDDGYVAVGYTNSTDIEGVTNNGGVDAIIVKYDRNGTIEWQKNYGGSSTDYFEGITTTTDGGYVAVGPTYSTDIEGVTNNGGVDAIIVKYDRNGTIEWQKNYGGSSTDYFEGITTTTDGGYLAVGYSGSTDIQNITNKGGYDAVIVKYDKTGNVELQKTYGGSSYDYFYGVTSTPYGGYLAVGYTLSTDIEGSTNNGTYDAFAVALSYEYDIMEEENTNGSFEAIQEGNIGKITINPDTGYELDEIIITDSSGNIVSYYEKDGYYYFDLTDDVTISVKYKEIVNPSTGLDTPYIVLISLIIIGSITGLIMKKKKYI